MVQSVPPQLEEVMNLLNLSLTGSQINEMFDQGHYIIFFTARSMGRFCGDPDDRQKAEDLMRDLTEKQLEKWGVKYHELLFGKPHADVFIDDKAVSDTDWFCYG